MPDKKDKVPENAPGRYYVDRNCIDCDACREIAPGNFTRAEAQGYSFVAKQPETPEEEEHCREARMGCPVDAIGDDGE